MVSSKVLASPKKLPEMTGVPSKLQLENLNNT